MESQPAGRAILHLLCDLPADLGPALIPDFTAWWDRHLAELITLDGFLSARRARRLDPSDSGALLTMYGMTATEVADQPRPAHFELLPTPFEGRVVFNRRVLQRVGDVPAEEPVGRAVLQLMRPSSDAASLTEATERVRAWPGVLSGSAWSNADAVDFHRRSEVIQLGDTDLVLAELDQPSTDLVVRAAAELPGWSAAAYEHTFPLPVGVLRPEPAGDQRK